LVDAAIVSVRVACHPLAALRATLEVAWPLLHRVGLPLQRFIEHLFGQHLTHRFDGVFDGAEFGAPGGPVGAVQTVDQALGHAFEVGSHGIGGRGGNLVTSHP
jgi:hypothetical protein